MKKIISVIAFILVGITELFAQPFSTQKDWEDYFKNKIKDLDPIEGIWSFSSGVRSYNAYGTLTYSNSTDHFKKIVIYSMNNEYLTYFLEDTNREDVKFTKTSIPNLYIVEYFFSSGLRSIVKSNAILSNSAIIQYTYKEPIEESKYNAKVSKTYWPDGFYAMYDVNLLKVFPEKVDYERKQPATGSGTGFAIFSNGIIATNYHVIDGAKTIKIRGVNFDFDKSYKAKVLVADKNNDLALIKIDDYGFTSIGQIPYTLKTSFSGVGENIFVLGYPLRATMGDEIKLTNGIISSETGYQGDITTYQISAPVQPGNSGGPLFDNQGNIVGMVNAKHSGAENVSYAVKSIYLINLLQSLPSQPKLQPLNSLHNRNLPQQVELAKKYVYIIETEY